MNQKNNNDNNNDDSQEDTNNITDDSYTKLTFVSAQRSHYITVEVDFVRHAILINDPHFAPCAPNELLLMLQNMIDELKKIDIDTIYQQVDPNEWNTMLKQDGIFEFVHNNVHGFCTVKCDIDKYPEAIMKGFG